MKLVTAIVQPQCLDELIDTLIGAGARGLTVSDVRGFGRQYGQLAEGWAAAGRPADRKAALLRKARLEIAVHDDEAEAIVQTIAKCASTGTIGDGKIWVSTLDSVLRIRTGERDDDAA
jgi:nitrogen regulatory protein PII